ncbi:helix-turn-helix domain-containing protein [Chryseobacterium chendengshani]|uniref:helix-turn-helix domain-containing protein n=1 Tax=Chryseobacterium sp. LJ668 TaxID=2864040 RepID=UPI001C68D6BD|nr:helix-turn-helix domain-containing protein [Chryseobacterium sp. LJ668]MBW8523855.1 helix-turn-helix domain-containing protein [Chryseobacterium sp. LJ668]QYK16798.1 helix-turn-helix domain-containing protein [Chryseobacterium sp. LJ668]
MTYLEIKPHILLQNYIDSYWCVKTGLIHQPMMIKLLPDGCIDIILNLGADILSENGNYVMKSGTATLVGTMTVFKNTFIQNDTHLIGIRFKPLGFSAFYIYDSLHAITNKSIEFEKKLLPNIFPNNLEAKDILDGYFLEKLNQKYNPLRNILSNINNYKGLITVDQLAKDNCISNRQLERNFKHFIGTSPKEYLNFVRYQLALKMIKQRAGNRSLLDIAFETGFYDHSHLTNQVKKRTGLPPSQFTA